MTEIAGKHSGLLIILWSLFCAALIIAASAAEKYWGAPNLWLAVLPVWWAGSASCLARRK